MSRILKELVLRTQHFAKEIAHYGRLGKVASQRGFLRREKKKLLLKLGEKCLERLKKGEVQDRELIRLVGPIEKIEGLLADSDYGGQGGREFSRSPAGRAKAGKKKRRRKSHD